MIKLKTPVPVWVPSAVGVVGLLLLVVSIFFTAHAVGGVGRTKRE